MPLYKFSFPSSSETSNESRYSFFVDRDNLLEKLAEKYMPSKRTHNYLIYYWMHFRDIRLEVKSVLEIGVQTDRSIRMWEEFFPNAIIYGIDIDPECKQFEGGRRKIMIGDQSDYNFLHDVTQQSSETFDIVIDDGSHQIEHQLKTVDFLLPKISTHGIYVIEDTGGCVGDYELRTVNSLKTIIDNIMYWPDGFDPGNWAHLSNFPDETSWAAKNVIGIAFYRWIVFIMRGRNPQDNPFLTPMSSQDYIMGQSKK
ncbi:MAG: hypothetical protein HKN08_04815 [Gammaproteobacteria bacterium]|nr:hypothetical protein [Gammaproteobacteria bacterium]